MNVSHEILHTIDGREHRLVLLCTAGRVSATLVYLEKGEAARVLTQVQTLFEIAPNADTEEMFEAVLGVCKTTCEKFSTQAKGMYSNKDLPYGHQKINKISTYMSGPWLEHRFHTEHLEWEEETEISDDIVNTLMLREIPQGMHRLNAHIPACKINGYRVAHDRLVGQRAREADLSIIESFARFHHTEALFQVLHTLFNIHEGQVRFLPLQDTIMHHAHTYRKVKGDYVVFAVYDGCSEVSVFIDDTLKLCEVVDFGRESLTKTLLAEGLAHNRVQAHSLLSLYAKRDLDKATQTAVDRVLREETKQLLSSLQFSVDEEYIELPEEWHVYASAKVAEAIGAILGESFRQVVVQKTDNTHTVVEQELGRIDGCAVQYEVDNLELQVLR